MFHWIDGWPWYLRCRGHAVALVPAAAYFSIPTRVLRKGCLDSQLRPWYVHTLELIYKD